MSVEIINSSESIKIAYLDDAISIWLPVVKSLVGVLVHIVVNHDQSSSLGGGNNVISNFFCKNSTALVLLDNLIM